MNAPTRQGLLLMAAEHADLLAAARATVAAADQGEADPLGYLRAALEAHGQLPAHGDSPAQLLAHGELAGLGVEL